MLAQHRRYTNTADIEDLYDEDFYLNWSRTLFRTARRDRSAPPQRASGA